MAQSARDEWRDGWSTAVIGMLGMAGGSMTTGTAGVFMQSFGTRFGWHRATYTSGVMVVLLAGVILMPIVGRVIDRIGPRPLAVVGVLTHMCGVSCLGLANGSVPQWWLLCGVQAIAGSLVTPAVWTTAAASRFRRSRGLAMAVALSGIGLGTIVFPLLATFYLHHFGGAAAFPLLALSWGIPVFPIVFFGFHAAKPNPESFVEPVAAEGVEFRDAILSPSFAMLGTAAALFAIVIYAMTVHLVPLLIGNGIGATAAAAMMGVAGVSAMGGRLVSGVLLDRFPARVVGAIAFLLPIAAYAMLLHSGASMPLTIVAVILNGLSNGAEMDILAYIIAQYYGMRSFASIYAVSMAISGATAAIGPLIAGLLYDRTGSYHVFLLAAMLPMLIASILLATLAKPPRVAPAMPEPVPA